MKSPQPHGFLEYEHVLGLDVGANSVGWALIQLAAGQPAKLQAAGVRAFEAGVEGDLSKGLDTSRAAARREKRLRRRLLFRRRHRLNRLATILQRADLLPPGDLGSPDAAVRYFEALDRELFPRAQRRANPHLLLYSLRARALDHALTPYELGRALYHLAHHRGFLSNRRVRLKRDGTEQADDQDEEGKVKREIAGLAKEMKETGARTLGQFLSRLDPEEHRVRNRYLGRKMLEEEFDAIWAAQVPHHPGTLSDELRKRIHQAIFFQRPLKSARHLIGTCELEEGRPRAPMCSLAAQRFRLLQKVNDLRVVPPDGKKVALTAEQRAILIPVLESQRHLTFKEAGKRLGLPKGHKLNFETEGEKGIPGCRSAYDLAQVFGQARWDGFSPEEREAVVQEMRSIHSRDALKRRAMKLWGLDEEAAQALSEVPLEDGYCNLSRQALAKVLPLMEKGVQYATARKQLYGDQPPARALASLPALHRVRGLEIRNPAVERALTEVRKVVNAVVREHGKPSTIRIELARDLKKPRRDRKEIGAAMESNRRAREEAAGKVTREAGIAEPRARDIEKWLLADECGWRCPYTGKTISVDALFGDHPQFDVEHIIPLHRSLDDSFANKTLCDVEENRSRKRNRSPWEAYHGTDQWEKIIGRVRQFRGRLARVKVDLFQTPPDQIKSLDEFAAQQLNDTRYASRLAMRYVGLLYGAGEAGVDPSGRKVVQATRGAVTSFLRDQWGLNFLGGGEKRRDDHRQHAIDAIVTALTMPAVIKRLSDAAAHAPQARRRRFAPMEPPWPGFLEEVHKAVAEMVVSHRVSRKVSGPLHEETIYSSPHKDEKGREWVHRRKPVASLSAAEVSQIVDPTLRKCVEDKLRELGEKDPKRAFKSEENHPALGARDGRAIPIHKVRLRVSVAPERIGAGAHERYVKLGSNHHVEILETTDRRGNPRWEGCVVSTLEAMRRRKAHEPVVRRDHGPGKRFLFSLAGGEIIELNAEESKMGESRKAQTAAAGLYVVRTISVTKEGRVTAEFVSINDARAKEDIRKVGGWARSDVDPLRKRGCRKVLVTPLGEVRRASD